MPNLNSGRHKNIKREKKSVWIRYKQQVIKYQCNVSKALSKNDPLCIECRNRENHLAEDFRT